MKLRSSAKVKINLSLPPQFPDKTIPPLLFTSYVENAFKHGISYQQPSFIDIQFLVSDTELTFKIRNSNPKPDKADEFFGIGEENARKRLDLIFGNSYTLKIDDGDDEYSVHLSIPI
jgi:LytS/YehU family sensor histidine kinase